ncbi:lipocalin family protein [Ferrimonas balearica]|uniref:lipocalin family protein n=1 Tax=Ferrimonas balearica TaxID=44012 RepID=UPI001C994808|nr:lipocalin family protein [Ferrimonas balearica]MBY5993906.1 lipocalin family protein [Ferrimonas balearica]
MAKCVGVLVLIWALVGCSGLPEGAKAVEPFELERYLGTWHELARLPNRFEKDLVRVTAEYSLREDGGVRVLNRGFNTRYRQWEEAEGRAYRVDPSAAMLKVSFFGPFYGAYNVIWLSEEYDLSLVASHDLDYLWLLAREPNVEPERLRAPLKLAEGLGFATEQLEWVMPTARE